MNPRLMRRLRILLGIPLALAGVGGIIYLTRPSPYEWYTSWPLDKKGTRVEFLVPRGWNRSVYPDSNLIEFTPPERPGWWPGWLKRIVPEPDSFMVRLFYADQREMTQDYWNLLDRDYPSSRTLNTVNDKASIVFCIYNSGVTRDAELSRSEPMRSSLQMTADHN